ncbi:MAG: L-lactate dehydrogenase [Endozoicomonadaceae bacterium]|nr:L-lactate dehydrogenase [Endozoicomonadaceae bacterium]
MLKSKKVALIGAGMVGTSFLYSAMHRGIANEYGIIDINIEGAAGNKLDLEDAVPTNNLPWKTEVIKYNNLKETDVLVIAAGRPQKPGETRLNMVADNAKIMQSIAAEVKKSAFSGITIIASNPVDVLTHIYQKVTEFPPERVISSGTSLDSARLKIGLSEMIDVAPQSISAYVLGEHGDSSVAAFSSASVAGKPLSYFTKEYGITAEQLKELHRSVCKKAYEIINRKSATYYGIGSALANLVQAVFKDTREVYACGAQLNGEYNHSGFYAGTAAIIGSTGIRKVIEIDMSKDEQAQFDKSAETLKKTIRIAEKVIA